MPAPLAFIPILGWIVSALTWIGGLLSFVFTWAVGFFAAMATKKALLAFVYVGVFIGLIFVSIASINLIVAPLIAPAQQIGGTLFKGLSYVLPPIMDTAVAAMISARICVWIFKVHLKIIDIVSQS